MKYICVYVDWGALNQVTIEWIQKRNIKSM